jgi:hypothetical protein
VQALEQVDVDQEPVDLFPFASRSHFGKCLDQLDPLGKAARLSLAFLFR